ncbi:amidohydrolase [Halalkalibacter krulwichiae]|uniref:N-acyl-L-amino acid amidohydrolase n=1 Tax=Halalkalibacter krulwichiae TaxID=199441 RepID=A0A1X9MKU4_9BACI|nr:amidohydrolase [Halalkalibacter krulwichiae]ARK32341.1 N-acyl-L-amino acid amidohydrolase [Halalkalibacter krulwichiae]
MNTTLVEIEKEVLSWRRHLHQHPELSYQEKETSDFIYQQLIQMSGLEVSRPTETSVVAVLKGMRKTGSNLTIAFRADMDALPIEEEAEIEYRSKNKGVMHACGHDAHTAMLLGAAKVLAAKKEDLSGEIRFVFQHAEEAFPGGASELVEKGIIDGVDYAFALHVSPYYEKGTICIREGAFCAAADDFEIKIIGSGGHASTPELTIDPLMIGAEITTNLQQIVARKISVLKAPVVSVTKFQCGSALNVIADTAELGGTIRSLNEESRVKARELLEQIVAGITAAHGASYEISWEYGYPAIVNDHQAVAFSREVGEAHFGKEHVVEIEEPMFGTEDFSAFSVRVPSSMQFIGVHNPQWGDAYPLHHPKFRVDEDSLIYGVKYFVGLAEQLASK